MMGDDLLELAKAKELASVLGGAWHSDEGDADSDSEQSKTKVCVCLSPWEWNMLGGWASAVAKAVDQTV